MIKSRSEIVTITGSQDSWIRTTGTYTPKNYSVSSTLWNQRTNTVNTPFHRVQRMRLNGQKGHDRVVRFLQSKDWGTNFRTEKVSKSSTLNDFHVSAGRLTSDYRVDHYGPVLMACMNDTPPFNTEDEESLLTVELLGLGTDAIARSHPGQPPVDLLVSAAELIREGIPSMVGSMATRAMTIRELFQQGGSEYLNIAFGWTPLVKDVIALAKAASQSRRIVEQFERDISRSIRRRYQFPVKSSVTSGRTEADSRYAFVSNTPIGGITTSYVSPWSTISQVTEENKTTTKSWFSGEFRWFFPDFAEGLKFFTDIEQKANVLLGTRLDPEVLWNLQPWSWLTDWFLNSGSFLHNVSAFGIDGLVMPYGYLMQTVENERQVHSDGVHAYFNPSGKKNVTGPYTNTQIYSRKARIKATPFGFGLNPDLDFSPSQWAILGALGLSQGLR